MTARLGGHYDKKVVQEEFRKRVSDRDLLKQIVPDMCEVLGMREEVK